MRGRIGLFVVGLAAVVMIASQNESLDGRRHKGCSSCGSSACATCTAAEPAPEKTAATPDAKASQDVAKAAEAPASSPAVSAAPTTQSNAYVSRRAARRGSRR